MRPHFRVDAFVGGTGEEEFAVTLARWSEAEALENADMLRGKDAKWRI
ncbi:MAG: hypothetical protein AAF922_01215 [Pseudomonadota bacterium]